ncbi:hypothetical protein J8I87_42960, partial [Paraburkholderia sp. LEh10]|uniref:hypothetical protein n=1 Tax=Paraburkholderia sp. LEh10 TaxID=2821353 RepID=UPI001AE24CA9
MKLAFRTRLEAGEAFNPCDGNGRGPESCCVKRGDVESPWVKAKRWRCERLSLLTFFAAAKKVSAAPHRG